MYIQPPFSIPKGYSGNAFTNETPPEEKTKEAEPLPAQEIKEEPPQDDGAKSDQEKVEATPVSATPERAESVFLRFPFLSSLLPPPRHKKEKSGSLLELAIIGAFLFLTWEDGDKDLLPFLLLLLLWD